MDKQYLGFRFQLSEMSHHYGKNVRILSDPALFSYLAALCAPDTDPHDGEQLNRILYDALVRAVVNEEFSRKPSRVVTGMAAKHPQQGTFTAEIVDREQSVVVASLSESLAAAARVCISSLRLLLHPNVMRHDLLSLRPGAPGQGDESLQGEIPGTIDKSLVLFPAPVGSDGDAICRAIDLYKNGFQGQARLGKAKKYIALHLIVTPEYLKNVQMRHSDLVVYALRLDRGLSPPDVLSARPGEKWDEERGLSGEHLVFPGGGEILNSATV